jgi:hypothetical protein
LIIGYFEKGSTESGPNSEIAYLEDIFKTWNSKTRQMSNTQLIQQITVSSTCIFTTQVIVRHRICLQTDGHGETSIPPYNFVAGGIIKGYAERWMMQQQHVDKGKLNKL